MICEISLGPVDIVVRVHKNVAVSQAESVCHLQMRLFTGWCTSSVSNKATVMVRQSDLALKIAFTVTTNDRVVPLLMVPT